MRKPITFRGETFDSHAAVAKHYGISAELMYGRTCNGWTLEQALELEPEPNRLGCFTGTEITFRGKPFVSKAALAKHYGVNYKSFHIRLKSGWTMEQALGLEPKPKRVSPSRVRMKFRGKTFESKAALAQHYGVKSYSLILRLKTGWTMEQALDLEPPPPRFRDKDGNPREHLFLSPQTLDDGTVLPSTKQGCYKLYLITNQRNGKEYIGITTATLGHRLSGHWSGATRGRNSKLYNAMRKALREGRKDDFTIEQIRNDAKDFRELQEQEISQIASRNTVDSGYNTALGGSIGTGRTIVIDGDKFPSQAAAAEFYGVDPFRFNARLAKFGWTPEQAAEVDDPPKNHTGTKWMRRGDKQIQVRPADVGEKLAQGWVLGMLAETARKVSKVTLGRKIMHRGNEQIYVRPADVDEKLAQGWVLGRLAKAT